MDTQTILLIVAVVCIIVLGIGGQTSLMIES